MKTRAYVDTNIFVYAILHHPRYGGLCAEILRDAARGVFEAYGSLLVAVELLGAISKINPSAASRAVKNYFLLVPRVLPLTEEAVKLACLVNEVVNVGYDSVHLALMLLNSIETVITNDVDDWRRLARRIRKVKERAEREGFDVPAGELQVVTPDSYTAWKNSLAGGKNFRPRSRSNERAA